MRKVYVDEIRPGMVLGKTIYNHLGNVMLSHGVELTPRYISAIRKLGFYAVYVLDGIADDIQPPEDLSDRVRMVTYKHVRELFHVVQSATSPETKGRESDLLTRIQDMAANQISRLYRDVEQIVEEVMTLDALSGVASLKTHDNYTYEHSIEVAVGGVMLGKRLHLSETELHQLALGCLCHDIGKLAVPNEVLSKPGRLTPEEFEMVKQHPQIGYETARRFMGPSEIVARHVVWQHHERQDGTGYPRGLRGNNRVGEPVETRFGKSMILPAAEIAAVADVYSALASDRPYRPAMKPPELVATLRGMAGTHLNSELVRRFLCVLPTYPVGTEVVVLTGEMRDYRGVVSAVDPSNVHQPKVRLLFDPAGQAIAPIEIDTAQDGEIELAAAPLRELAAL